MNVIDMLKRHEGLRLSAYQDSLGYWTIGYGRLIDARKNAGISRAEAEQLLRHDVERLEIELAKRPWWLKLNATRQAVIVDMAYNLGLHGLLEFTGMIAAIKADDYAQAAAEILDSKAARQLPNRYHELAHLMEMRA